MQDIKKIEEEVTDNEGVTLPPETQQEGNAEGDIQLNNSPKPIEEGNSEGSVPEAIESDAVESPSPEMTEEQKAVERMFSQSELNDIVGQRVVETKEKTKLDTLRGILDHYGCDNEEALDLLVGDGQRFPMLKEELEGNKKNSEQRISELENSLRDVSSELALFKSNINPDRYEDVKLILKGKGLDISSDNIKNEMATHPEWENKPLVEPKPEQPVPPQNSGNVMERFEKIEDANEPVSKISRLGNGKPSSGSENEHDTAMDLFDIK